jgi:hypothetical protein
MEIGNYKISLIFSGTLLITSFVPVFQIIFMYWNGGILALLENITGIEAIDIAIPFNFILSLITLFAYFKSEKTLWKIIIAIFTTFFINGMVVFAFMKIYGNSDANFYALQFISGAILTGIGLFTTDRVRLKNKQCEGM